MFAVWQSRGSAYIYISEEAHMSAVWHRRGSARTGTCIVAPCLGLWACSAVHHDPVCTAGRLRWGLACLATHTHTQQCAGVV